MHVVLHRLPVAKDPAQPGRKPSIWSARLPQPVHHYIHVLLKQLIVYMNLYEADIQRIPEILRDRNTLTVC